MRRIAAAVLLLASTAQAQTFTAEADYMVWWLRRSRLPPVVAAGTPGSPDYRVIYGDTRLETRHEDRFLGGRVALGLMGADLGAEARAFFMERDSTYRTIRHTESPLSLLYTDARTGQPDREVFAGLSPQRGPLRGSFVGYSRIELFGQEANALVPLAREDGWRADLIAGARFLQMRDRYHGTASSSNTAPSRGFGTGEVLYGVIDNIRSHTAFYGAQVGVRGEADYGAFFVNARLTGAIGADSKLVRAWGERVYHTPAERTVTPVGLYIQRSNTGRFSRFAFDAVGEVAVNAGVRLTERADLFVGYTFLLWGDPLRSTDQVDTVVNRAQGSGGPLRPGVPFKGEAFWAQGVNVGLRLAW
ncbi:MAG: BBP7 family outer membrane beta-barrel protein [Gemmataceae bacterium]|nr:BBP7 family outer membrane beta-barrel protein [Gemmataceae bacterium]